MSETVSLMPMQRNGLAHSHVNLASSGARFHPATGECLYLPAGLRDPEAFQSAVASLDSRLGELVDPCTRLPITALQFLTAWTKFKPPEYYRYYFMENVDTGVWTVHAELFANIQAAIHKLELVIADVIAQVGGGSRWRVDNNSYQEKLQCARSLSDVKMADKLLKLRVELMLARLLKLKALHGGIASSGKSLTGSISSRPAASDLTKCFEQAWLDPHRPLHSLTTPNEMSRCDATIHSLFAPDSPQQPSHSLPHPSPCLPLAPFPSAGLLCARSPALLRPPSADTHFTCTHALSYPSESQPMSTGPELLHPSPHPPLTKHPDALRSPQQFSEFLGIWTAFRLGARASPGSYSIKNPSSSTWKLNPAVLNSILQSKQQLQSMCTKGFKLLGPGGLEVPLCADNVRSELFARATSVAQANAEQIPNGNLPPFQIQDAVEGLVLLPTPNPLKQSVSPPDSQGACGGTLPRLINNSTESLFPAAVLCSYESLGSQLSSDALFENVGTILRARRLHDPGGSQPPSHPPSFWNLNDSFCFWAHRKATIYSFLSVLFTSRSDEYCRPSGHIRLGLPQFCCLAHISIEYGVISSETRRKRSSKLPPSKDCFFGTIEPVIQAGQPPDPGGPGIYVSSYPKTSWDLNISFSYWTCQNDTDRSNLVVLFTGRLDKYCVPSGRIRVDLAQIHLSTHSFAGYGWIASKRCLAWSPWLQLLVCGLCVTIRQVLHAQQSHDHGGLGALSPFTSIRTGPLSDQFACMLYGKPRIVAFSSFHLRDDWTNIACWVATSLLASLNPLPFPGSSPEPHILLLFWARLDASTRRFLTSSITPREDPYSLHSSSTLPNTGSFLQISFISVNSCSIWIHLAVMALIVPVTSTLSREMASGEYLGGYEVSFPAPYNIHVFLLYLHGNWVSWPTNILVRKLWNASPVSIFLGNNRRRIAQPT